MTNDRLERLEEAVARQEEVMDRLTELLRRQARNAVKLWR